MTRLEDVNRVEYLNYSRIRLSLSFFCFVDGRLIGLLLVVGYTLQFMDYVDPYHVLYYYYFFFLRNKPTTTTKKKKNAEGNCYWTLYHISVGFGAQKLVLVRTLTRNCVHCVLSDGGECVGPGELILVAAVCCLSHDPS